MIGLKIEPKDIKSYANITLGAMSEWSMTFCAAQRMYMINLDLVDDIHIESLTELVSEDYISSTQESFVSLEEYDFIILEL